MTPFRLLASGAPNLNIIHLNELFLETLLEILKAKTPIFLLVDAIDECVDGFAEGWKFQTFVKTTMVESASLSSQLHFCVSSRLVEEFDFLSKSFNRIEMDRYNREDIRFYIKHSFEKARKRLALSLGRHEDHFTDIMESIMAMSEGSFLWMALSTEALTRGITTRDTQAQVFLRLQALPQDLQTLFTFKLSQMDELDKEDSKLVLTCASTAQRMLTLLEFTIAAASESEIDQRFEDIPNWGPDMLTKTEHYLQRSSAGMLITLLLVKRIVAPICRDTLFGAIQATPTFDLTPALKQLPLLDYVIQYLFTHVRESQSADFIDKWLKEFLSACPREDHQEETLRLFDIWGHLKNIEIGMNIYGPTTTPLHLAACFSLDHYVSWWFSRERRLARDRGSMCDRRYRHVTESGQSVLHWAAFHGDQESLSQGMLMRGRDVNHSTPLHPAAARGHQNVTERLVEAHKELPDYTLARESQLEGSIKNGKLFSQIVSDQKEFINCGDRDQNTALHLAVSFGHLSVVEFLLNHGADWTTRNRMLETPAMIAVRLGCVSLESNRVFQAIGKLLNAKAYEALDLAESPLPEARFVDRMFGGTKFQFAKVSESIPKSIQISIHGLINGLNSALGVEDSELGLNWIHLPANNLMMLSLFRQKGLHNPDAAQKKVFRRELWAGRQHQGSQRSQITFMKPGAQLIAPVLTAQSRRTAYLKERLSFSCLISIGLNRSIIREDPRVLSSARQLLRLSDTPIADLECGVSSVELDDGINQVASARKQLKRNLGRKHIEHKQNVDCADRKRDGD
ncbi:uncharacterized protein PAC_18882 [Phialocephala subalpina]|uniref:Uncharacterized protein n=1 Tax=Phialocephala subalpina TaxID=576137 RepID=A0A1L7XVC1_9HELO|nr:uncharacterized protein PAC_18882 [Phialocephala subalpina]